MGDIDTARNTNEELMKVDVGISKEITALIVMRDRLRK
jgi:hypothetical protein